MLPLVKSCDFEAMTYDSTTNLILPIKNFIIGGGVIISSTGR
jgi:hypothetical protein